MRKSLWQTDDCRMTHVKGYVGISPEHQGMSFCLIRWPASALAGPTFRLQILQFVRIVSAGTMSGKLLPLAAGLLIVWIAGAAAQNNSQAIGDLVQISPCSIGPTYWCQSAANRDRCGVEGLTVGCVSHRSTHDGTGASETYCTASHT